MATSTEKALDFSMKKPLRPASPMSNGSQLSMSSPQSSDGSRQSPSSTTPAAGGLKNSGGSGLFFPSSLAATNSAFLQPYLKPKMCPTPPFLGAMASAFSSAGIPFGTGNFPVDILSPPTPSSPWTGGANGFFSTIPDPAFFPTGSLALSTIHRRRRSETPNSHKSEGGNSTGSGPPAKRPTQGVPEEKKDELYWERRRKNNEAAKRSRDTRRHKEEEIAMRAAILEQENLKLRAQVAVLKNETAKLHFMLISQASSQSTPGVNSAGASPVASRPHILT